MRNISFSMTTEAVRRHEKTVTRRLGWWTLQPGEVLQAVEKAQGLKRGEHVKPICLIRVVSVIEEPLWSIRAYGPLDVIREGFPTLTIVEFIDMFIRAHRRDGICPTTLVNRIGFEYVETHACPPGDSGTMPCCGRTPFEVPGSDRMTLDPALVTCGMPA